MLQDLEELVRILTEIKNGLKPDAVELDPVPLGPEDVPPGSVLRNHSVSHNVQWVNIRRVTSNELSAGGVPLSYRALLNDGWEILRPGEDWQPCHKPAP